MTEYNGWKNYETWNVALWIGNDELLYEIAKGVKDYERFKYFMTNGGTPDNISWYHVDLDIDALNELIKDIKQTEQRR